jgi:NAD(P)-binding Rossmann-like domain
MIDGALVLPGVSVGMIEASATQSFNAMHPKLGIDDCHWVGAHLAVLIHALASESIGGMLRRERETGVNDPVDVLIIGAGASGAAVAWSLADTRMHILCLEQGGWMNPATYPSTGRDWEARAFGDYSPSPNIRARPEDYPINDDNSPIKVVNFNGVGGGTVMYTAHFPRLHPSDFRVRTLDGVAEDWPIDYDMLVPFFEENDRMMGVSGLAGDPGVPPRNPPMPPLPLGRSGAMLAKAMNRPVGTGGPPIPRSRRWIMRGGPVASISGIAPPPARRERRPARISPTGL